MLQLMAHLVVNLLPNVFAMPFLKIAVYRSLYEEEGYEAAFPTGTQYVI